MSSIEKDFHIVHTSKILDGINLFQVDDYYFDFPDKKYLIIDAGVDFIFGNDVFSLAWNQDLDSFVFEKKSFIAIYEEDNYYEVESKLLKMFNNSKVIKADFKWKKYDVIIDYTMKTKQEKKLVEIVLHFDNDDFLQIATVNFDFDKKHPPTNFYHDISGYILLSANNLIQIL